MVHNNSKIHQNIFVPIIMLLAIFAQILFLTNSAGYFTVFLPAAIAAGFYVIYGKRVVPGLTIATLLGVLSISFLFTDKTFYASALYALPIFFVNVLTAYLMNLFIKLFKCKTPDTLIKGVFFFIAIFITTSLVSLFPAFQYTAQNGTEFIFEYGKVYQPIFIGIAIFSSSIILSVHYDSLLSHKYRIKLKDIVFVIVFMFSSYVIFNSSIIAASFSYYGPIFILLFMINAFIYNYRMLIFNSFIYILFYSVFYLRPLTIPEAFRTQSWLNIYLFILLVITIVTKIIVREIKERNNELIETKEKITEILDSTLSLLSIKDTLSYDDKIHQEDFMHSIFDIAIKIFPEIEFGVCALQGQQELIILDTKKYDLELLQSLNLPSNNFRWTEYKPILNVIPMEIFKKALGDKYQFLKTKLPQIKQSISILIKLGESYNGVITFDIVKSSTNEFTKNDIDNIGAFQRTINSYYEANELTIKNNSLKDDIVLSLIRTLELYDPYTSGHSEDVATISKLLAKKMNLSKSEIYDIYWAGIVHDIGKIGISSEIINKTSRLTLEEYKEIQKHPVYGFDILNRSNDLKTIAKLVKHHHEWYNGGGYPDGIDGSEIPLGAQILQVADSVSSMATKRSYQKKKTFDEIIGELKMYKHTQFNPIICEHMIDLIESGTIEDYFNNRDK